MNLQRMRSIIVLKTEQARPFSGLLLEPGDKIGEFVGGIRTVLPHDHPIRIETGQQRQILQNRAGGGVCIRVGRSPREAEAVMWIGGRPKFLAIVIPITIIIGG